MDVLVLFSLLALTCAQFCVDEDLVAKYTSDFSEGKIWRDGEILQLELNGEVMSNTQDEHMYHELLVHPAMLTARDKRRVLIIGGAEGATAREVLRHAAVESVTMVDIDKQLVEMCRTHLRAMHQGSFDSPKMHLHFGDGVAFLQQAAAGSFDVIIVDGIDLGREQLGAAAYGDALFSADFYKHAHRALSTGGTFVQYMSDAERRSEMQSAGFEDLVNFGVDIASFPGWGARFMLTGRSPGTGLVEKLNSEVDKIVLDFGLSYLTQETVRSSLEHTGRRLKGGGGGGGGEGGWSGLLILALIFACCCCFILVPKINKYLQDQNEEGIEMEDNQQTGLVPQY